MFIYSLIWSFQKRIRNIQVIRNATAGAKDANKIQHR